MSLVAVVVHFESSFTHCCLSFGLVPLLPVTCALCGHKNREAAAWLIRNSLKHIRSVLGDWFVTATTASQLADN